MANPILSNMSDRVLHQRALLLRSTHVEHVRGSILRIEVQRLAESTSSSEKFEPRDVHELCGPHDAESCSAERILGAASGGERRRANARRLTFHRALLAEGGSNGGASQTVKVPPPTLRVK